MDGPQNVTTDEEWVIREGDRMKDIIILWFTGGMNFILCLYNELCVYKIVF